MTMYDQTARTRLQEKLSYELWLLDFLSRTQETFEGGTDISTIKLEKGQPIHISISISDTIGGGSALKVIEAMSPLTFVTSYKILDMVFEWILEENKEAGNITRVPWQFSEKIKLISNSKLVFPPLFQSEQYIREYLFTIYTNLLKFRNEVVHKHKFSVLGDILKIDTTEDGQIYTFELNRLKLGALARIVVAAANLLLGILPFEPQVDRLFKYHLDLIKESHGLAGFWEKKPVLVNVVLKVPEEKKLFPLDLEFVRKELCRIHPDVSILFNLKVIGIVNDEPSISWFFPVDSVPKDNFLELRPDSYEEYRSSLQEEE